MPETRTLKERSLSEAPEHFAAVEKSVNSAFVLSPQDLIGRKFRGYLFLDREDVKEHDTTERFVLYGEVTGISKVFQSRYEGESDDLDLPHFWIHTSIGQSLFDYGRKLHLEAIECCKGSFVAIFRDEDDGTSPEGQLIIELL